MSVGRDYNETSFLRKPWMPWICAKRLFGPAPGKRYDALQVFSLIRANIGFIISCFIYAYFHAGNQQTHDEVSNIAATFYLSTGLTLILTIVMVVRAKDISREAWQPFVRAVQAVLVLVGFELLDHFRNGPFNPLDVACGILFLWYVPFTWTSFFYWWIMPFGSSKKFPS